MKTTIHYTVYEVLDSGERTVSIGVSSPILFKGLSSDDVLLRAGNVLKVSEATAADLLLKEIPIWKIS